MDIIIIIIIITSRDSKSIGGINSYVFGSQTGPNRYKNVEMY